MSVIYLQDTMYVNAPHMSLRCRTMIMDQGTEKTCDWLFLLWWEVKELTSHLQDRMKVKDIFIIPGGQFVLQQMWSSITALPRINTFV